MKDKKKKKQEKQKNEEKKLKSEGKKRRGEEKRPKDQEKRPKDEEKRPKDTGESPNDKEIRPEEAAPMENPELIFRALGDGTRLQIIEMLTGGEMCAAEILKSLSIVQSTLSHHMKILCESGMVSCRRQGRWSYYSVSKKVIQSAQQYLGRYIDQ